MAISLSKISAESAKAPTLAEIRESILAAAREAAAAGRHDQIEIALDPGWYDLTEPFVLSATENPELSSVSITIRAAYPTTSVISSLKRVDAAAFVPVPGKPYFACQLPKNEDGSYPLFHDLFVNNQHLSPTKSPVWRNPTPFTPKERSGEEKRNGFYVPFAIAEKLAGAKDPFAELMIYIEWEFAVLHVTGVDLTDVYEANGEKYALVKVKEAELDFLATRCHRALNIGNRETFFQNAPAFLSEPDSFAYDYDRGILYLLPADRESFHKYRIFYPTLENLFRLEGLEDFTLEGLTFTATTSKHICRSIYYSGQANTVYGGKDIPDCVRGRLRHAAVLTADMRRFTVKGCAFRNLGGNGMLLTDSSVRVNICDNVFENVSMSALSVGNPTTEWENPKNRNYAIRIENNYFHHIAYEYPSALCMYVGMVDDLKLLHNTVLGCGYSAMSIGWGWCRVDYELGEAVNVRDAEIAYNRIENYMDVLRDGGAIYVVGGNCNIENARRFNVMHDNYASLAVRRDHSKYGYYCDGSSTNWEVRDSVIVNCATPIFSQHTVHSAYTFHNHFFDIYSTTRPSMYSHAPYRDSIFRDLHVVEDGKEALFAEYPEAKRIYERSGCSLTL